MNKQLPPLRPAMTAIAAVIALSSTPLLAQTATSTVDQAAPVVVAPPPPTVTAPPAAEQTSVPNIATPAPSIAPQASPAPIPSMKTVGTPVVHETDDTPTAVTQEAAPKHSTTVASKHTASAPGPAKGVASAIATPKAAANSTTSIAPPAVKAAPTPPERAASPAQGNPAPNAVATQTTHTTSSDDETLPIAGGIGLAVIALGGAAAYAMRRRRREREEEVLLVDTAPADEVATPEAAAPQMATPVATPSVAAAMPKTLPNGFDISRFGRHTQAAYVGPTQNNPSYSLKKRLKRASFFDQREREAAAAGKPIEQTPIAAPVSQAASVKQDDGQITVRLAPQRKRGGLGYLLQR